MTPIDTPFLRKSYRSIIDYYSRVDSCTLALKVVQNEYKQPICHDLPEDTLVDTLDVSIEEELLEVVSTENEIHTGYKLCSIDVDREWTNIAMNHGENADGENY